MKTEPVKRTDAGSANSPAALKSSDPEQPLVWYDLESDSDYMVRFVRRADGSVAESRVPPSTHGSSDASTFEEQYESAWLRAGTVPNPDEPEEVKTIVDLFCGCGGMSLGVVEAARALEMKARVVFAADTDETARRVFADNFGGLEPVDTPVDELFGLQKNEDFTPEEEALAEEIGEVDVLVGGPPCQGHSNLNNHSRRNDDKNALFFSMAQAAELLEPQHIVIENVRDIIHDEDEVFSETEDYLRSVLKYKVDSGIVRAEQFGVPQRRHRMFLVASQDRKVDISDMLRPFETAQRSFDWACGDLTGTVGQGGFDSASRPTAETKKRIDWLFDNRAYDLPNPQRPPCHRDGDHSYKSVYGRIRPDEPVQTITTGFTYMGQGRFVHPKERRTITPHEAARLQFFPDFFNFGELTRGGYKNLIGNAVPPKLTFLLSLQLLR